MASLASLIPAYVAEVVLCCSFLLVLYPLAFAVARQDGVAVLVIAATALSSLARNASAGVRRGVGIAPLEAYHVPLALLDRAVTLACACWALRRALMSQHVGRLLAPPRVFDAAAALLVMAIGELCPPHWYVASHVVWRAAACWALALVIELS